MVMADKLYGVWAYKGPKDYVGRGKVRVTDLRVKFVAKAVANDGGLATFTL